MSVFTIHSIGDSAFLEQILTAVSMIVGTGDFERMVSVGLLLGIFMICVQALFQGGKRIDFQQILVGWILYACFFIPTTTVTIEDAYTGDVRVVRKVPIGIGFAGGVISNIGYTITHLFETGYGVITPGVTEQPFAETLKLLNDTRRRAYSTRVFSALDKAAGGGYVNTRESWTNYIRECTLNKIDLNLATLDEMMNSPIEQTLFFKSELYGTHLYLSPNRRRGDDYDCTEAWTALEDVTRLDDPLVSAELNALLGIPQGSVSARERIGNALDALGETNVTAIDYLKAAVLQPLYDEAAVGRYQDFHDFSSAIMLNQAILQRNTQWAAEHSMFTSVVRPMLTFFEGFIYAITPLMAFMIVMGGFGISLAGRYVQAILWIQLWMPVLSIVNLFICNAASGRIASLRGPLDSIYGLDRAGHILQNWISTGGMLAAATPMISLFIVTGSTYAFTSLVTRIGGADHIDEKIQSPDITRRAPLMDSRPAYEHSQFSGALMSGAESTLGNISFGSTLESGVSSARTLMKQKSEAFQHALGHGLSAGGNWEESRSRLADLGRRVSSQHTRTSEMIDKAASDFMETHGIDKSHAEEITGAFAAHAGLGAGVPLLPGLNFSAGVNGSGGKSDKDSTKWRFEDIGKYVKEIGWSEKQSAAIGDSVEMSFRDARGDAYKRTWGEKDAENLTKTSAEALSSSESFNEMSAVNKRLAATNTTDLKTLGAAVAKSPEATRYLDEYWRFAPREVRDEAIDVYNRYQRYGMNPEVARAASRLRAMTGERNYPSGKKNEGYREASKIIAMALPGFGTGDVGDPYRNSDLGAVNANVRPTVESATGDRDLVTGRGTVEEAVDGGAPPSLDRVRGHQAAASEAIQRDGAEKWKGGLARARQRIIDGVPGPSSIVSGVKSIADDLGKEKRIPSPPVEGGRYYTSARGGESRKTYERKLEKWNEELGQVKENRYTQARDLGLTKAQAGIYSEAPHPNAAKMKEYEDNLRHELPDDPKLAEAMINTLKTADDVNGAYTASILEYNRLKNENPFASMKKNSTE